MENDFKTSFTQEVQDLRQRYTEFADMALQNTKKDDSEALFNAKEAEERTAKCISLLPINFNSLVVNPDAVLEKNKTQAPSKSAEILAKLKEIQTQKKRIELKDQSLEMKKSLLMAQVHLKNIQIDKPSP